MILKVVATFHFKTKKTTKPKQQQQQRLLLLLPLLTNLLIILNLITMATSSQPFNYDITLEMEEEKEVESEVGNLVDENGKLLINYNITPSTYSSYFRLEKSKLIITKRLDREEICPNQQFNYDQIENLTPNKFFYQQENDFENLYNHQLHNTASNSDLLTSDCIVPLTVVESSRSLSLKHIAIKLIDINDNVPTFPSEILNLEISESAPLRTSLYLPEATDPDQGTSSIQSYQYVVDEDEENTFKLGFEDDLMESGVLEPRLVVHKPLDREKKKSYTGWLLSTDGGMPPKTGKMKIIINITDTNDNSPRFTQTQYTSEVPEDLALDSRVLEVKAFDPDEGANGKVVYKLKTNPGGHFKIDSDTGVIFLSKELDREKQVHHFLTVAAQDMGPASIPVITKVMIKVSDTNDNSPSIFFGSKEIKVSENKESGMFVSQFSVEDKDEGENGMVSCWLSDDPVFYLEQHHPTMFIIKSKNSLDRENQHRYDLEIKCMDEGNPRLDASESIQVLVEDENDNCPIFSSDNYVINTSEDTPLSSKLIQVKALDLDFGKNAEVTFEFKVKNFDVNPKWEGLQMSKKKDKLTKEDLKRKVDRWFKMDPSSGLISVHDKLDYEMITRVFLEVTASDQGVPFSLNSTVKVTINIYDVNDQPPVFSHKAFSFGISENLPAGTSIGHVTASDMDSPPFDSFVFAIADSKHIGGKERRNRRGNKQSSKKMSNAETSHSKSQSQDSPNPHEWFSIDANNGKLITLRPLDREQFSVHRFWVTAMETHHPFMVASAEVTVNVADLNDNSPFIFFPSSENSVFHIPLNAGKNYPIANIVASDADVGENAKLIFSIVQGNEDKLFEIDSRSGDLVVAEDEAFTNSRVSRSYKRDKESEIDSIHRLIIMVKDSGETEKMAVANVEIYINKSLQVLDKLELEDESQDGFLKNMNFSTSTGKYILCMITVASLTFVVILIILAIFARRVCLKKKKSQHKLVIKKENKKDKESLNNFLEKDNKMTKAENNLYATVKHSNKNLVPSTESSPPSEGPFFKSIDISNDLDNYVFETNTLTNPTPTLSSNNTPTSSSPIVTTSNNNNNNNNYYNNYLNNITTFQKPCKTFCHEEALNHSTKYHTSTGSCNNPIFYKMCI